MTAGLIDTSVFIDLADPSVSQALPTEVAICTITLAELAAGPHQTTDPLERARRQVQLQEAEQRFAPIDFDRASARKYCLVVAAIVAAGRQPRRRIADLQIASVAIAQSLDLYTRNPGDFVGLEDLLTVYGV